MSWLLLLALTAAPKPTAAVAGRVVVKNADGTAADNAGIVVYVTGFSEDPPAEHLKMWQRNRLFVPDVLPVTAGQTVDFTNDDVIWHNIFSVSKARAFDLGMTKKPETKAVTFTKTGVIDVYCNIHPQMVSTVLVLPNRAFAVTGSDGKYRIDNLPPGDYKIFAWSRRSDVQQRPLKAVAGPAQTLDWQLAQSATSPAHKDKYGREYKAGETHY